MCAEPGTADHPLLLQLEHPETKPQNDLHAAWGDLSSGTQLAERFRHSGWKRSRGLIYDSLRRTMQSVSRIVSFTSCGDDAYVYQRADDLDVYRLAGSSCRDRFCLPCSIDRSRCLATNVLQALKHKPSRFVTLTLKQTDAILALQLDKLYDSFRRLRARSFWNRHVVGGCAFLEVKWSTKNLAWNVHLHCIVHGTYLPKFDLSKEWWKVTGDSHIVDVRFVDDNNRVGRYVTKYVSKPFNNTFLNRDGLLDEVVRSIKGRRLCLTFGDWRGIRLTESPNEHDWISLGSFHDVALKAVGGDQRSIAAIQMICGANAKLILDSVAAARPPPLRPDPPPSQLTFAWPGPLLRDIV